MRPAGARNPDLWAGALAAALAVGAVWAHPEFGVTWDEAREVFRNQKGPRTFAFWTQGFAAENAPFVTGHNPFVLLVYYTLYRGLAWLGWEAPTWQAYHLFSAWVAVAGVGLAYLVARRLMSGWWALGAAALLAVTPRWVGDGFANFKDIPFAVAWLACLLTLLRAVEEPSWRRVLWHGAALGLLVAVRIGGLMFLPVSALGLLLARGAPLPTRLVRGVAALALAAALHYLSYPYLLLNPISGMVELLSTQSRFAWTGQVLTLGTLYGTEALPRWYAPVWLLVTLPEVVLVGLLGGLAALRRPPPGVILLLASALVPLAWVIAARAPIYDGIRHILFVVPPLVILSVMGLRQVGRRLRLPWFGPAVLGAGVLWLTITVIRLFPYPIVYFNELTGGVRGAQGRFTLDYWAATSRESAQWLAAAGGAQDSVCIVGHTGPIWQLYLPRWEVDDVVTLDECPDTARYAYVFAANDWLPRARAWAAEHPGHWREVHAIERLGATLGVVFENPGPTDRGPRERTGGGATYRD